VFAVITYPPIPIFEVGPLQLSLHGVFAALGFIAGAWLTTKMLGQRGFDTEKYQSALTWGLIGALLGARYFTAPAQLMGGASLAVALNPISGNFSIMGGFAGGIIAGAIRMRMVGLAVWPTLDVATFGLAVGTIVGRIGDLAIVEHLGTATTVAWGYGIKAEYDVAPQHDNLECVEAQTGLDGFCGIYHHVAAYDMLGAIVLFGVLYFIYTRLPVHYGQMFFIWVSWYGFQRFLLDALRIDNGDAVIGAFTWNQVSGFAAGVVGLGMVWWMGRTKDLVTPEADRALAGVETLAGEG
jgi:prolipoprotein diacylglyceryltransferase